MVLNDSKDDKSRDRDRTRRTDRPSRFSNVSKDRDRSPIGGSGGHGSDPRRRIIVSNIPFEYRWQDLKDLFRTEVGDVTYVEILNDDTGKPRGSAIVEFQSPDLVRKAVNKMHRFETKGRKLVIKEAVEDKGGRRNMGGGGGVDRDLSALLQNNSSKFGNTYGLSPQFLESLGINCPLINKVFVANLDYKVDEKKLREVFRLAGKVENVEIALDKDGKSRGFGTVEFDHPVEAVQSISMLNNQNLFERRITVRMDRVADRLDGPVRLPEGLKSIGMGLGANGAPLQDVARNLPNMNTNPTPTASVSTPAALAAAVTALTQAQQPPPPQPSLGNLGLNLGLGGAANDLTSNLTSTLTSLAAANQNTAYPLNQLSSQSGLGQSNILSGMAAYSQGMQSQSKYGQSSSLSSGNNVYSNQSAPSTDYSRNASNMYGNSRYGSGGNEMDYGGGSGQASIQSGGYGNPRAGLDSNRSMNQSSNIERDTVVVKNLPPTITWQELRDKFRNYMMDRTRIDGKIIDVTFF
ncbi:hypothetical protein M8J75_004986 [Diaphorina citri]|nr:hypothetical protein M8J75_004986 [Diaphorina citri]